MDKYTRKINFDFPTNQRVMQLIAAIDEYRGKWIKTSDIVADTRTCPIK